MRTVLAVNAGSSSLKLALFTIDNDEMTRAVTARVERIGDKRWRLIVQSGDRADREDAQHVENHTAAFQLAMRAVPALARVDAIGHRIVRGAAEHHRPALVTPELLEQLRNGASLAPDHDPHSLALIAHARAAMPNVPQVACFDTAFHRTMPAVAQMYGLPRRWADEGVLRLGFHGLSCEHVIDRLTAIDPAAARDRVVVAHLGSGSSLTAIRDGKSVDTTMGFSPASGLVMATRCGDVDPAVLLYFMDRGLDASAIRTLINRESGLLGVSQISSDMRELLEREANSPAAAEAVALFCYMARKHLGAMTAALGGLDTLVFTGGIGEHAAPVRERICAHIAFLGAELDPERNGRHEPVISSDSSRVTVRIVAADEERVIARHVRALLKERGAHHVSV